MEVSIHTPTQGVTKTWLYRMGVNPVSIHTPTQGVTTIYRVLPYNPRVSIHTPTQGVTYWYKRRHDKGKFQSTHPRRVWHFLRLEKYGTTLVSIHTPTQGVTGQWGLVGSFFEVSIHTPTQGVTENDNRNEKQDQVSIHTPTQGVTSTLFSNSSILPRFQSTHPRRVWLYI